MNINVFLMCFNEEILLPHTIKHYRNLIPSCKITICDNESTDNSVHLARSLGCEIISWSTGNIINDYKLQDMKNNCWKNVTNSWVIVADMDEYLMVTEEQLKCELEQHTSILQIQGLDMIGESKCINLTDINFEDINKYVESHYESKKLCFFVPDIHEILYNVGAHTCNPQGRNIKYSTNIYYNKHMSLLGEAYLINKITKRYERSEKMRKDGLCTHYTDDINKIKNWYNIVLTNCKKFNN